MAGTRASPRPRARGVLVLFEGLAAAVAWERDAAAGRLRTAGARHVAVLDGAAAERAVDAVREARRLVARPVAVATVGVLPADVGGYLAAAGAAAAGSAGRRARGGRPGRPRADHR